eukprot:CAMPEP_0183350910 /NCGR_PEP_ID=MMETSP0164_2-20130417/21879_1 /TAXON_ID=221442 /ORGANISM="Coccolithus pelagicus ssp braarudi, Strain PLY182g" /LENGTH=34 /DNA_ID= /DNA_START= /DNA_END= /DNA_ORIENTATION=
MTINLLNNCPHMLEHGAHTLCIGLQCTRLALEDF